MSDGGDDGFLEYVPKKARRAEGGSTAKGVSLLGGGRIGVLTSSNAGHKKAIVPPPSATAMAGPSPALGGGPSAALSAASADGATPIVSMDAAYARRGALPDDTDEIAVLLRLAGHSKTGNVGGGSYVVGHAAGGPSDADAPIEQLARGESAAWALRESERFDGGGGASRDKRKLFVWERA